MAALLKFGNALLVLDASASGIERRCEKKCPCQICPGKPEQPLLLPPLVLVTFQTTPRLPTRFYDLSSDDEEGEVSSDGNGNSDNGDDSDLDYVSQEDTTIDPDEPLSAYLERRREKTAPGQPGFRWRKKENVPRQFGFDVHPGVNIPELDADSSPLEIFSYFFTDELMDVFYRQRPAPSSVSELSVYIGLRMAMGLTIKPEQRGYWSTNLYDSTPLFPETMPRDRFDQLSRFLPVADNEGSHPPDDRLWKLRPVIEIFQRKRAHFGVKVYKLAVSEGPNHGYICAFEIYMGKDKGEVPASQRAVVNLMGAAGLFDKGLGGTNAVGTVRVNRKFMPKDLQVRASGDVDSQSTSTDMCLQWRDKCVVTMLSTVHRSEMVATLSQSGPRHTLQHFQ
ncbi:piggyBac transposable element-derived protein 4-like [Penaeus indicus]|uniref:piggyBac transposable element-derived protein 4-like n=1 Tax=Penaeus indicus TaxID=29960 RepID=UPI00300D14A3